MIVVVPVLMCCVNLLLYILQNCIMFAVFTHECYSRFRVFSPECTLHTAFTHVIKVLVRRSLT